MGRRAAGGLGGRGGVEGGKGEGEGQTGRNPERGRGKGQKRQRQDWNPERRSKAAPLLFKTTF